MTDEVYDAFLDAAYLAGALSEFKYRLIASAALAINNGDDFRDVLASLIRNRQEWFSEKEQIRRQRKARLQSR